MRKLLSLVLVALIAPVAGSKPSFAHPYDPWTCVHMPPGFYYHVHDIYNPFIWYCYQPVDPPTQPPREDDGGGEIHHVRSFSGGSGRQVHGFKCFNWGDCRDRLRDAVEQCERVSVRGSVIRECKEHFRNEEMRAADYFR